MSKKLLTFLLSEVRAVRVICQKPGCDGAAEVSLDRMKTLFANPYCPICGGPFQGFPVASNPLVHLAKAMLDMQTHAGIAQVEFVLPDESDPAN